MNTALTNGVWRHAESISGGGASPSTPPVLIDNTLMGRNYPEALHCSRGLLVSSRHSILDQFQELLFPSVTTQTQQGRWGGVKEKKEEEEKKTHLGGIDSRSRQNFASKAASFTAAVRGLKYHNERPHFHFVDTVSGQGHHLLRPEFTTRNRSRHVFTLELKSPFVANQSHSPEKRLRVLPLVASPAHTHHTHTQVVSHVCGRTERGSAATSCVGV